MGPIRRIKCIRCAFSKIHLVDRCLILFMFVLLAHSAYNLIFPSAVAASMGEIDIVVRTSSAGIFGYFLSANFIRHTLPGTEQSAEEVPISSTSPIREEHSSPQNRIGFALPDETAPQQPGTAKSSQSSLDIYTSGGRFQIIIATAVGLFCLFALLLVRNLYSMSALSDPSIVSSASATVTQFRDFISGCVGFLIGSPTSGESQQ